MKTFCSLIYNSDIKARFHIPPGIPVYATAHEEPCDLLWSVGFRKMVFPLESTDAGVLEDMNKEFTPDNWHHGLMNWAWEKYPPTEIIID